MADRVGQQLGHYRLVRLLGQGGFADVYLGEHVYLDTQAAIKVLHTQLARDGIEPFRLEAKRVANLEHPHIVRVLDFGIEETTPFLVMSYAPGGTLRQRHPKGTRLPFPLIVQYVKQVADALQYAHEEKFIHCDVKPENLLLGRRNDVLLSDFGIATIVHSTTSLSVHTAIGTVPYMAPEQFQEHPRPASDQYALGVMVYEWLCGDCPFDGSFAEIVAKHLTMPPPPLRGRMPAISGEVEKVVMTALAKDYKRRFSSVQAFAYGLEQASLRPLSRIVLPPAPISFPNQPVPPMAPGAINRPNQFVHPAGMVMPANPPAMPIGMGVPISQAASPTGAIIPASQPFLPTEAVNFSGERSSPTATTTPSYAPMVSPLPTKPSLLPGKPQPAKGDISRRAVVLGLAGLAAAGVGIAWLVVAHPSSQSASNTSASTSVPTTPPATTALATAPVGTILFTYRGHPAGVRSVAWSPDGKRIASGGDDYTLQVWNATTGTKLFTSGALDGSVTAAWSPDGRRIVSSNNVFARVWDATTGRNVLTYTSPTYMTAMAWSPDSRHIVSSTFVTVQVWDAYTGMKLFTYKGLSRSVSAVAWSPDGKHIASGGGDYGTGGITGVQVWDATTGSDVLTYKGHSSIVNAMAWSPDSKRIASGSQDDTVQVWDATTSGNVLTYKGHSDEVHAVAWSPDGKRIASGSFDGTVQVWDASAGVNLFTYQGHSAGVNAVAWSPDGKCIASGSFDGTVQVWSAG